MTFDDCRKLRRHTKVRLSNGRIGRMTRWHRETASIAVQVVGESAFHLVSCALMKVDAEGDVVVSAPAWSGTSASATCR